MIICMLPHHEAQSEFSQQILLFIYVVQPLPYVPSAHTYGYLKMEIPTYQASGHVLIPRKPAESREAAAWVLVGIVLGIFILCLVCNPPYLCIQS